MTPALTALVGAHHAAARGQALVTEQENLLDEHLLLEEPRKPPLNTTVQQPGSSLSRSDLCSRSSRIGAGVRRVQAPSERWPRSWPRMTKTGITDVQHGGGGGGRERGLSAEPPEAPDPSVPGAAGSSAASAGRGSCGSSCRARPAPAPPAAPGRAPAPAPALAPAPAPPPPPPPPAATTPPPKRRRRRRRSRPPRMRRAPRPRRGPRGGGGGTGGGGRRGPRTSLPLRRRARSPMRGRSRPK